MDKPPHFSMIRDFHLADWFTLANAFCGMGAVVSAMAFLTGADPIMGGGFNTQYQAPGAEGGMDYAQLRGMGNQQNALQLQADQFNASQTNPWMQAIGQVGGTYLGAKMAKTI